ncbi:MAG: ABC transporter ATP-binding protein [Candidatus Ratteibacteria bacterium]|jgi:lipooligosaccharide transport system ATP-binding protein
MNKNTVVEAKKLTKSFRDFTAVKGIDFSVAAGECFGILGPNGAGKTTTVRMVSCFMPATEGRLEVFNLPVNNFPRQIKARLGVCPQEDNLDPDLNVLQNLLVYARYFDINRKEALKRTEEILDFIGLASKKRSAIEELSGGMKRRLVFGRSLLNRPDLLILDEPTSGLDPQGRHQVWEYVAELKTSGKTFLLTTHYMEEAAQLCDRLIIMDEGKIVTEGSPAELIKKLVGRNVIEVSGYRKDLEPFLKEKNALYEKTPSRIIIFSKDSEHFFSEISQKFCDAVCNLRMANLEDVFLKLTGRDLKE